MFQQLLFVHRESRPAPFAPAQRILCSRHVALRATVALLTTQPNPKAAPLMPQSSVGNLRTTIIGMQKLDEGTAKITQNLALIAEPERERAVYERKVSVRGYVINSKRGV